MATLKQKKEEAKKENLVDTSNLEQMVENKTPNGIKLTESELNMIANFERNKKLITDEVSFIAQQQLSLDYRQEEAEALYRRNVEFEKQIGDVLTQKYGNGTIDTENGVFIPA